MQLGAGVKCHGERTYLVPTHGCTSPGLGILDILEDFLGSPFAAAEL